MNFTSVSFGLVVIVEYGRSQPDEITAILSREPTRVKQLTNSRYPNHFAWMYITKLENIDEVDQQMVTLVRSVTPYISKVKKLATTVYFKLPITTRAFQIDRLLSPELLFEISQTGLELEISFMYIGSGDE